MKKDKFKDTELQNCNVKKENLQVLISTQNLQNDEQVNKLLKDMNVTSNYLIINQTTNHKCNIKNSKVITKFEKGLSKSRNIAIKEADEDIVLLADDDLSYTKNYREIILQAYKKYKNADIICFYVESINEKRKIKKMLTSNIGFIKAMKIASSEISFKRKTIIDNNISFNEKFGAGTVLKRGEEQIFLYEALKKKLNIIFVNKKIATVKQEDSSWFNKFDEDFFVIQGKIFRELSSKFYFVLCLQYVVRKYFLYRENISFFKALKCILKDSED